MHLYSTNQMCFHHNHAIGLSVVTPTTASQLNCFSGFVFQFLKCL